MPVYKATNEVQGIGIVGYVCLNPEPPPSAPLKPPGGPRPPQPGSPPAAPPSTEGATVNVSTYMDSEGDCWKVIKWNFKSPIQPRIEKIPINCADL